MGIRLAKPCLRWWKKVHPVSFLLFVELFSGHRKNWAGESFHEMKRASIMSRYPTPSSYRLTSTGCACGFKFYPSLLVAPLPRASGEVIIANVHDFIHNIQYRVKLAFLAFSLFFLTIYFNTFGVIIPNISQLARWGLLCWILGLSFF